MLHTVVSEVRHLAFPRSAGCRCGLMLGNSSFWRAYTKSAGQRSAAGAKREYRLAHTDAEGAQDYGYLKIDSTQTIETEVPTILREALEEDFESAVHRCRCQLAGGGSRSPNGMKCSKGLLYNAYSDNLFTMRQHPFLDWDDPWHSVKIPPF